MINKIASILDYSMPSLDPAVWGPDLKLYLYQKDFIIRLLNSMYENYSLKEPEKWVDDAVILGSITTNKWIFSSDIDVHIRVNLDEFVKTNMPNSSKEEAFEKLDTIRKEFDRAKILLPTTIHPCEFYYESLELHPSNTEAVGVYSLFQDKWLKEPVMLPADLDFEETKKKVIEEAENLAEELDGSFGKIRRDIKRIEELDNVIKAWGKDKQQLFYNKIEKKLNDIEEEITKDLKIKQDLVDYRHSNQDATSDNEILFKYLARNGFFAILQSLKELLDTTEGKVTTEELPEIKKIVSEAAIKDTKESETDICIDLDRTIASADNYPAIGEPIEGAKESLSKLQELGYNVIIYSCRGDTEEGLEAVREWLDKNEIPYDSIFEGEKPFAKYYIDDKAIHFDNWNSVLEQVEKSGKTASLIVTSMDRGHAAWIDPLGEVYYLDADDVETHVGWIIKNIKLLKTKYGISIKNSTHVDYLNEILLAHGWSRFGDTTHAAYGLEVSNIYEIPKGALDFLFQFDDGKPIMLEDIQGNWVQVLIGELKEHGQDAVNQGLQRKKFHANLKEAKTKKIKQGEYGCLMALVPHELAQEIVSFGVKTIPDDALYIDEDAFGRELEVHCTIKYGLISDDDKTARKLFDHHKPFKVTLGKVRHFEPNVEWGDFDVVCIEVISEDLKKANEMVCEKLECAKGLVSDDYKPHITLAYVKKGLGKDFIGSTEFEGKEIELDTLVFSPAVGNKTYFSIGNSDKEGGFVLEKMDKQASIEEGPEVDGRPIKVLVNPSLLEASALFKNSKNKILRYFVEQGTLYLWDAYDSDHYSVMQHFGYNGPAVDNAGFVLSEREAKYLAKNKKSFNLTPYNNKLINERMTTTKTAAKVPFLGEAWRGQSLGGFPPGTTAADVVRYEATELGNNNNVDPQILPLLEKRPASDLIWVTKTKEDAQKYGDPQPIELGSDAVVIGQDEEGGYLILKTAAMDAFLLGPKGEIVSVDLDHADTAKEKLGKDIDVILNTGWVTARTFKNLIYFGVASLKNIPPTVDNYLAGHRFDQIAVGPYSGNMGNLPDVPVVYYDDAIERGIQKAINKAIVEMRKTAEFLPSFVNAPDNRFQFENGGDNLEIPVDPDSQSDEETDMAPCTTGKPRKMDNFWNKVIPLLKKPFSKKETVAAPPPVEDYKKHKIVPMGFSELMAFRSIAPQEAQDIVDDLIENNKLDQAWVIMEKFLGTRHNSPHFKSHVKKASEPEEWDKNYGDIWHVGDKVHLKDHSEEYTIKSIDGDKVTLDTGEEGTELETTVNYIVQVDLNQTNSNKPKTTWDDTTKLPNQHEPYSPLPVTLDVVTNPQNENWRFPWKFTRRPIGEDSNQGEVDKILEDIEKNKKESSLEGKGYFISPEGEIFDLDDEEGHFGFIRDFYETSKLQPDKLLVQMLNNGWTRVREGDYELDVEVADMKNIPAYLEQFLMGYPENIVVHLQDTKNKSISFDMEDISIGLQKAVNKALQQKRMNRQAGNESTCYTDQQMEDIYNEQHMNDTDQEPYTNHDQRDISWGYHDSPENTDSGIGWAKDNTVQVVFLDQLQKSFDQPFSIGLPSYSCETFVNTYPQSDGMEVSNNE